jgi:hypothetical protein
VGQERRMSTMCSLQAAEAMGAARLLSIVHSWSYSSAGPQ